MFSFSTSKLLQSYDWLRSDKRRGQTSLPPQTLKSLDFIHSGQNNISDRLYRLHAMGLKT